MKTDITVLLDRSGSMDSIRTDTIGGFNTMLADQQKLPGEAHLTLVQFDSSGYDVTAQGPLATIPPLTLSTFVPRDGTPLLWAMNKLIDAVGQRLAATPSYARPDKVVVVIITDGQENTPRPASWPIAEPGAPVVTKAMVNAKVTHQREVYKWEFLFLGANQDAIGEAASMGIPQQMAGTYRPGTRGVNAMYQVASLGITQARAGEAIGITSSQRDLMMAEDDTEPESPSTVP